MIEAHWWAIVWGALLCTAAWLYAPELFGAERSRIPVMTLTAAALWFLAGTTGDGLTRYLADGTTTTTDVGVLAWACYAGGVVSILTFLLFQFDQYPPEYFDAEAGATGGSASGQAPQSMDD